ncbi:MAG: hypothetical protein JW864_04380 [Spirochaetes bacterium]|nr:hypothetical protein [Spirochaetota bacterium]
MKIFFNICLGTVLMFAANILTSLTVSAQEVKSSKTVLTSSELETEGNEMDKEIDQIYKKINEIIVNYKLLEVKDIKILPYRTTYNVGENFIEIEKYELLRDTYVDDKILGINKKIIKVGFSGNSVSRLETQVIEQYLDTGSTNMVIIDDPSPSSSGTDDITFTQIRRNRKITNSKKLSDIKNNRVSPLRNNIKKEFIIPHLNYLYNTLLDIAETYYKGLKDSDSMLTDFLRKSTKY